MHGGDSGRASHRTGRPSARVRQRPLLLVPRPELGRVQAGGSHARAPPQRNGHPPAQTGLRLRTLAFLVRDCTRHKQAGHTTRFLAQSAAGRANPTRAVARRVLAVGVPSSQGRAIATANPSIHLRALLRSAAMGAGGCSATVSSGTRAPWARTCFESPEKQLNTSLLSPHPFQRFASTQRGLRLDLEMKMEPVLFYGVPSIPLNGSAWRPQVSRPTRSSDQDAAGTRRT